MNDNRPGSLYAVWARARTPLTLVARLLLGLVFALSAVTKITAPGAFRDGVAAYHLLPRDLITPFAMALPWIEALIALYLLIGLFLRPTAIVTAALLVMFTAAIAISLARGNTGHGCGCFGDSGIGSLPPVQWLAGGATITPFDVVRDLVFILLAAAVYWGDRYALSLEGLLFRPANYSDDESDDDYDEDDVAASTPAVRPAASATRAARAERMATPARGAQRGRN